MNLGYIDYLNCYPFYYHAFEKMPLGGVNIVPAYPSDLNRMMKSGELDMSPISSGAYPDMRDDIMILPHFCLSSVGYIKSVVMMSKYPIDDLNGKRLGLSSASQTSVVMLKILLKKFYKIDPVYVSSKPSPDFSELDAALVIGNEAMLPENELPYVYDLGDLWLQKTGYPVVFAIFVINKKAVPKYPDEINAVIGSYRKSLKCLKTERDILICKARERYPNIDYDVDAYYSLFKFDFSDELKSALMYYFNEAAELGYLKKVKSLGLFGKQSPYPLCKI